MTLGEHCDEIVRLIDETLGTLGALHHPLPSTLPVAAGGAPGMRDTVSGTPAGADLGEPTGADLGLPTRAGMSAGA
ncbi:MAG: hypothetical protein M0Z82_11995 [Actinomycetota bacterium]|jgi:hypothetical protein|nr:hypothetical protein [Actinomycetota bacterium]